MNAIKQSKLTTEEKKSLKYLTIIACILIVFMLSFLINLFRSDVKVEKIFEKRFEHVNIETYNEYYLVVGILNNGLNEKETLTNLRFVCKDLNQLKLKNGILVIKFYNTVGWDKQLSKQISMGMSNIYNNDWNNSITYEEFKKIINW